jgi:hypothetical protein
MTPETSLRFLFWDSPFCGKIEGTEPSSIGSTARPLNRNDRSYWRAV